MNDQDSARNPYRPPETTPHASESQPLKRIRFIVIVMLAVCLLSAVVGFASIFFPGLRTILSPRFGWIGLVLVLNPAIFLGQWLWSPQPGALLAASFMFFAVAIILSVQLVHSGTKAAVLNPMLDRLHSSWGWSILPYAAAGAVLCWLWRVHLRTDAKE